MISISYLALSTGAIAPDSDAATSAASFAPRSPTLFNSPYAGSPIPPYMQYYPPTTVQQIRVLGEAVKTMIDQGSLKIDSESIIQKTIFNFRDLSHAVTLKRSSVIIAPKNIFRTACLSRGKINIFQFPNIRFSFLWYLVLMTGTLCILHKIGDVDHIDVTKTLYYLRDVVGIKTMIDLRNKDEKEADPCDHIVSYFYPPPQSKGISSQAEKK